MHETITDDLLALNPLITPEGAALLRQLRGHPHAPRFNHTAGDRMDADRLAALDLFRAALQASDGTPRTGACPHGGLMEFVQRTIPKVPLWRERIPRDLDPRTAWNDIPTMSREDIALHPEQLVPDDAPLDEMIVYRTAGTTGHALLVPHHPLAAACYQALIERILERRGVRVSFAAGTTACFLVGAQARTVTYPTVLAAWNGAGFVKMNLNPRDWPGNDSPHEYFRAFAPALLTGDPISYAEMLRMGIAHRPKAMITTAVAMSGGLRQRLEQAYCCPVIDFYSLTETGPIACGDGSGAYVVVPHDIFVEALGRDGHPVTPGERGEIAVTGGRNPFLPLLRYRTGDWGRIETRTVNGREETRLLDLEGRQPVLFRATDGAIANPVDLSRILREFPIVQHEFVQHADLSCELTIRPISRTLRPDKDAITAALRTVMGSDLRIAIRFDAKLGSRAEGGKITPYKSELLLED